MAVLPYWFMIQVNEQDPNLNTLRNVMVLKLIRFARLNNDFIPDD
jgi:hypothetical protein